MHLGHLKTIWAKEDTNTSTCKNDSTNTYMPTKLSSSGYKQGCGSGSWKRSFFCGSGSAKILPLPHRLFDLKRNLAQKFCPFPDVD